MFIVIKHKEMLFMDCKPIVVTSETVNNIKAHPKRYVNCSTRVYMGKVYTDEEVN